MKIPKIAGHFIVLCLLLLSTCAFCSDGLPAVESFFNDADVQSAALSPKGAHVALLNAMNGNEVLIIRDTGNLKKFTIASTVTDNKILAVHWINEDKLVFSLKNQRGNYDLYVVNRDGSDLSELISGSWDHHQNNVGSNIKDRTLTADYVYYSSTHDGSDDIIVAKLIFNQIDMYANGTHLYRMNTKTKKLTELLDGVHPANVSDWILDSHDVPRLAMSAMKGVCTDYYYSVESKTWSEIDHSACLGGAVIRPLYFESDSSIFVSSGFNGYEALYKYDLKNRKIAAEPFISIKGFDFTGQAEVDRASNQVMGFHYVTDAHSSTWLDPRFKDMQKKVDSVLTQTVNILHCASDCLNSPVLLVVSSSDRQPTQYSVFTPASGSIVGIGGAHEAIKPAQMGLRDFYHYQAGNGRSIPVYVTVPAGKAGKPLPAVVLVHGGPNLRGASWEWEGEAQFLASRGYLVIQPEFRGSAGFGFDHLQAGWKQWGLAMQSDLADAARWAIQKGWADPKRVGIMGASYGGYATLMGLIRNPDLFRCGVEWAGVTDINMMFDRAENDATQDALHYGMRTTIGNPDTDAAMLRENSPLNHADKLTQPILMAHGALDLRVPVVHATEFYEAVSRNNKHVEWILYADEQHGWGNEKNRIDFWNHVEAFLDKNLKNAN